MQLLALANGLPVYLPYDYAHVPFGDPFNDVTITSNATSAVVTVPGYAPTNGDLVMFTSSAGNTLAAGLSTNFVYYVISASSDTFHVASTKGGTQIGTTTSNGVSGQVVVHLLSNQVDGTIAPFKSGNTVLAVNLGTATVTLQGASDANELAPGSVYPAGKTPPGGPGTYSTIASVAGSSMALVVLNYDWINASGGALYLVQN